MRFVLAKSSRLPLDAVMIVQIDEDVLQLSYRSFI